MAQDGVVFPQGGVEEAYRERRIDGRDAIESLDANNAAKSAIDLISAERESDTRTQSTIDNLRNALSPDAQTPITSEKVRSEVEQTIAVLDSRMQENSFDVAGAGTRLEQELQELLLRIPEQERESFTQGFLRHHDLLRNVDISGNVSYSQNPDEERPHPGDYIPAALVRGRGISE